MLRLKSELFFDKKKSKETKSKVSLDFSMFFFQKSLNCFTNYVRNEHDDFVWVGGRYLSESANNPSYPTRISLSSIPEMFTRQPL